MLGLTASVLSRPSLVEAQTQHMQSQDYVIQMGHLNITSGEKSGGGFKVTDTVGQTAAGEFNSAGYTLYAGFQYLYALSEFTFTITDLSVRLGDLTSTSFATASHELIISTRTGGYTIYAQAQHPLRLMDDYSYTIPFTNCDSGCSITTAGDWTSPGNPGFGFNVAGANASSDFNGGKYRPFADLSAVPEENAQAIASTNAKVTDDTLTVNYQASVDNAQAAGNYEAAIDYIAVPQY